jgi:hypothetical protein
LCQVNSESQESALRDWMQSEEAATVASSESGGGFDEWAANLKHQLEYWQSNEVLVSIKDLKNCWSVHFLANDESVFIDIIKTDTQ